MKAVGVFKKYGIYLVLILMIIYFSIASKAFLVPDNLFNVARQVSMMGIAAVGMAFVLLLGGIDLAIGSQITVVNVLTAYLMVNSNVNPVLAVLASIAVSTSVGLMQGWIIANIGMPPLIVTLSTMTMMEGVGYIISGGVPIFGFPKSFAMIGQGYIGIVPIPVIIMTVVMALGAFILNATYFGRYFYAVGGNEEAAKLSGINVKRVKYLVYTLSGLFAGIAGIVMLSRTNSAQPVAGKGFEFDVLTGAVVGGVSVEGGYGKISNVVAGVLILGVLSNGMVLLNINNYIQMVIKGAVLMFAVAFDCLQKRKTS